MYYYTIEDMKGISYRNFLFTSLSSAEDMVEKLERETGNQYWVTSMVLID